MSELENTKYYFRDVIKSYLQNHNKIFSKKYSPSLRELLADFIELYNDITTSPENKKLKNSIKSQLDVMSFYLRKSILYNTSLKSSLNALYNKIDSLNKQSSDNKKEDGNAKLDAEYYAIYKICTATLKALDKINLYEIIISEVKCAKSYIVIDQCVETLINELLYDGYSIRYLEEWYSCVRNQYENEIENFIDSFCSLKQEKKLYDVYFTITNDNETLPICFISNEIELVSVKKEELPAGLEAKLLFNQTNRALKATLKSLDGYSASDLVIKAFDSYSLIVNIKQNTSYKINHIMAVICGVDIKIFNRQKTDVSIILPREVKDKDGVLLDDFMKYRNSVYENNLVIAEIFPIERSLNILHNYNYESDENSLISLWNVLEYILGHYSGDSIISKARFIIPKIMCLYYLKDKVNIFWTTLQLSRNHKQPVLDFISESEDENYKGKYDIDKLLNIILSSGEELSENFGTNKYVLSRKYLEIGMLLHIPLLEKQSGDNEKDKRNKLNAEQKKLKKEIEELHRLIDYDIVRIYRTRNILIHSGNITRTNILLKNARLTQYLNNLMALILHYKMKNSNHSISEILYSVPETYNAYLNDCINYKEGSGITNTEIVKPKYLFL